MYNPILYNRIPTENLRTPNKEVGAAHRHRNGSAREGGVRGSVDQQRRVRGTAKQDVAAQRLRELGIGQTGDDSVIRGEKGDAGVVVELGDETGAL